MRVFKELGRLIEQNWREKNYAEEVFPEIAAHAFAEIDLAGQIDPWEITNWLHTGTELPLQNEDRFSDLPITLYSEARFRIDAYFWLDGTTSIHRHGFSGAFQVFSGSSIHSVYTFEQEREVNSHFATGDVLLKEVEVLEQGSIRRILPGCQFIHSLFHLDRPSVTITVRTHKTPAALPQFTYLKPHIAVDPYFKDYATLKKIQSVNLLLRMGHHEAYRHIGELVSGSDFQTTFSILRVVFDHLSENTRGSTLQVQDERERMRLFSDQWEHFQELFEKVGRRHGHLAKIMSPVLEEIERGKILINLRAHVTRSEHRFFLALLLNVSDTKAVLELVRQRFPQRDPADTICDWVKDFTSIRHFRSSEQNILGINDFKDAHLSVFRFMLKGLSADQIRHEFVSEISAGHMAGHIGREDDFAGVYQSIQRSFLLNSLLSESATTRA